MKAVVLGGTRGLGRALARLLAARGERIFLLGRDPETLARSARDLELRGAAGVVGFAACDLLDHEGHAAALAAADDELSGFDTVIVTAALFGTQEHLESDAVARDRVLCADFVSTVAFCELVRTALLERGGGSLCVFSSVAGEVPRGPATLYGAAKAGLSHYLRGLDRRFRGQGLKTVLVKPGFVRTFMTAELPEPPFAVDPEPVARRVLLAIDRGWPEVYAPAVWRAIMAVFRVLPRAVMRRLRV